MISGFFFFFSGAGDRTQGLTLARQALLISGFFNLKKPNHFDRLLVAHACNSSFSGARDQEDQGSKLALGE
jgi:hypothetical protein